MDEAVAIVVPVCICVILPIALVWIIFHAKMNRTNKQTDIIMEVIKTNPNIDAEKLIDAFRQRNPSPWEYLNRKLLRGSIFTLLGIVFALVAAFIPDKEDVMEYWVVCGVLGSIGIGFLISYLFGYKHIEQLSEDWRKENLNA